MKIIRLMAVAVFVIFFGTAHLDAANQIVALEEESSNQYTPTAKKQHVKKVSGVSKLQVDINTADEKTLMRLPGIGAGRAKAIIAYRKKHGPFKHIKDLIKVRGIGKRLAYRLEDKIIF